MTINDRIILIMNHYSLNKNQLAVKLGVHATVIHNIVDPKGRGNFPSYDLINKILSSFEDINGDWFVLGRGQMFIGNARKDARKDAHQEPKLKKYDTHNSTDLQTNETPAEYAKPNIKKTDGPPGCELCNQKDKTIEALQTTINTQKLLIDKLQEIVQGLTESSEQKRKAG